METQEAHWSKQTEAFIKLFERRQVMNTKEMRMASFDLGILNPTARMSDARKLGYEWEVTPISGTHMSLFKFKGKQDAGQLALFKAA